MGFGAYLKSVKAEAKRVIWPKGEELRKMVFSVVGVSAVFAIIFLIMDLLINLVMNAMGI